MRYVKCENCGADISKKPKYILSKVSETKGKHRNTEQEVIARLCFSCGKDLFYSIGRDIGSYIDEKYHRLYLEKIYDKDKKRKLPLYGSLETTIDKSFCIDGKPYKYVSTKLKDSKAGKLLKKIMSTYALLEWMRLWNKDRTGAEKILLILRDIGKILSKYGYEQTNYALNPAIEWEDHNPNSYEYDTIHKFFEHIRVIREFYIENMEKELENDEYRNDVMHSLVNIYEKIGKIMIDGDYFVEDEIKHIGNYIDV